MWLQPADYDDFRRLARGLIASKTPPREVTWIDRDQRQPDLFGGGDSAESDRADDPPRAIATSTFTVAKRYAELAPKVACHRSPSRWELLYRVLHRMQNGEPDLMRVEVDDDVHQMVQMEKAVRRDVHKMKAFVRFRRIDSAPDLNSDAESCLGDTDGESSLSSPHYVAWHRPDHRIMTLAGPFFARRFAGMRWTILTPDASASWDGQTIVYGPGADVDAAPESDDLEDMWRTYYASIFNPARVKIKAMKAEMPVRHWPTLPETELIPELIANADGRVADMISKTEGISQTAASFLPGFAAADDSATGDSAASKSPTGGSNSKPSSGGDATHPAEQLSPAAGLQTLSAAAEACTACPLHEPATQTVFGRGPVGASIVMVGEQPGDQEDLAGEPFVGPAGGLLNEVLQRADIDRDSVYLTNVVKHFKFVERGKRRIHKKPSSREIFACRPWLEAELQAIEPPVLVCLGATAAQAIMGRDFRITKQRGQIAESQWCRQTICTWHPAAVLRMPDADRREAMEAEMVADLLLAQQAVADA